MSLLSYAVSLLRELDELYRENDETSAAFAETTCRLRRVVAQIALYKLRALRGFDDASGADDVAQSFYMEWVHPTESRAAILNALKPGSKLASNVKAIAKLKRNAPNEVLVEGYRRPHGVPPPADPDDSVVISLERAEFIRFGIQTIEAMREPKRTIATLYFIDGLTLVQIESHVPLRRSRIQQYVKDAQGSLRRIGMNAHD
ncbi:hypothetical protein FJZ36_13575 [Candidatus Poribacteria bacterium]|nr:hypothetical protein [Candidatus Poribacteria bacterium]